MILQICSPCCASARTMPDASLASRLAAAGLDWIVPDWPAPSCVHALSTTRRGGAAGIADFSHRNPDRAGVRAELRRFLPADPLWLEQVHGTAVVSADSRIRDRATGRWRSCEHRRHRVRGAYRGLPAGIILRCGRDHRRRSARWLARPGRRRARGDAFGNACRAAIRDRMAGPGDRAGRIRSRRRRAQRILHRGFRCTFLLHRHTGG